MKQDYWASPQALDDFLRRFEDGTFPKAEWDHQAHVVMAASYLLAHPMEQATEIIRRRIPAYNVAQGGQNTDTSGYHETLTIFWIRVVAAFLASLDPALSRVEKVGRVAEHFAARRGLFRHYYSFDVPASTEARKRWIEPDLLALP